MPLEAKQRKATPQKITDSAFKKKSPFDALINGSASNLQERICQKIKQSYLALSQGKFDLNGMSVFFHRDGARFRETAKLCGAQLLMVPSYKSETAHAEIIVCDDEDMFDFAVYFVQQRDHHNMMAQREEQKIKLELTPRPTHKSLRTQKLL